MLLILSIFNLKPDTSPEKFADHLSGGLAGYETYLRALRQRFIGLYHLEIALKPGLTPPEASLSGAFAEVRLSEEPTVSAAALREVQFCLPKSIQGWLDERRGFIFPKDQRRLWLQSFGLSPLASVPRPLKGLLIHVALRYLPAGKTIQELEEFDRRIIGAYSEYLTQSHWYHIGSFHIFGLPEYMYVDTLDVIQAADRAEALANDAAVPVTPEMQAIYDECDQFLNPGRERYHLWLSPLVLSQAEEMSFA